MLNQFFHYVRHTPARAIARRLDAHARLVLEKNISLKQHLEEYRARSSSTGTSYSDYLVLYNWIKKYRPKEVLECGTGVSTVVIAQALMENERDFGIRGRVTSLEEEEKYFEMAQAIFPSDLRVYTDIIHSPAIEDHYHIFRGACYEKIPTREYDFVYVDGPSLGSNPAGQDVLINMDFIRLVRFTERPIAAIIDTRTITCYAYSLLLPARFRYDYLRKVGIVYPSTQDDLKHPRQIVASAMQQHAFKRPGFLSILWGSY